MGDTVSALRWSQITHTPRARGSGSLLTRPRTDERDRPVVRARQYDPTSGRFLQRDPVTPSTYDPYVAAYVYANNRPSVLIDPSGLCVIGDGPCPGAGAFRSVVHGFETMSRLSTDALGYGAALVSVAMGASARPCGNGQGEAGWAVCVEGSPLVPPWATAWTLGHTIFSREPLDPCLKAHELTHVGQGERSGFFVQSYILETVAIAVTNPLHPSRAIGRDNRYEREAYDVEDACYAGEGVGNVAAQK
jgi:RHS repeat-associated protein